MAATFVWGYVDRDYHCRFHGQCVDATNPKLSRPVAQKRLYKRIGVADQAPRVVERMHVNPSQEKQMTQCVQRLLNEAKNKGLLDLPDPGAPSDSKVDDADCPESVNRQKRDLVASDLGTGFDRCVPLVSKNPIGNPYHPLLTGMEMEDNIVRLGKGASYVLLGEGIECPSGGCKVMRSVSLTISNSKSVSINNGQDDMVSISNSTNWSNGVSTSEMKSITDSLQQSKQHVDSSGTTESTANSFQETVSKTHSIATDRSHTTANQKSITEVASWQHDNIQNQGSNDGFREDETIGRDSSRGMENGNSASSSVTASNTAKVNCNVKIGFEEQFGFEAAIWEFFKISVNVKVNLLLI